MWTIQLGILPVLFGIFSETKTKLAEDLDMHPVVELVVDVIMFQLTPSSDQCISPGRLTLAVFDMDSVAGAADNRD